MLPWPFGVTVTIQRATPNRFNDNTYADHHQIPGCIEYPTATTEEGTTNTHVTDNRELLLPPGSDILATDRVLLHPLGVAIVAPDDPIRRTNIYQVLGGAKDWQNPFTGWHPGMQVSLERIT
jgi:hypothetical protein